MPHIPRPSVIQTFLNLHNAVSEDDSSSSSLEPIVRLEDLNDQSESTVEYEYEDYDDSFVEGDDRDPLHELGLELEQGASLTLRQRFILLAAACGASVTSAELFAEICRDPTFSSILHYFSAAIECARLTLTGRGRENRLQKFPGLSRDVELRSACSITRRPVSDGRATCPCCRLPALHYLNFSGDRTEISAFNERLQGKRVGETRPPRRSITIVSSSASDDDDAGSEFSLLVTRFLDLKAGSQRACLFEGSENSRSSEIAEPRSSLCFVSQKYKGRAEKQHGKLVVPAEGVDEHGINHRKPRREVRFECGNAAAEIHALVWFRAHLADAIARRVKKDVEATEKVWMACDVPKEEALELIMKVLKKKFVMRWEARLLILLQSSLGGGRF